MSEVRVITDAMRQAAEKARGASLPACVALERLDQGLRVLTNLSQHDRTEHWNMEEWAVVTSCGTIGCAGGHMAMDPWFNERGLYLTFTNVLKPNDCQCEDCKKRAVRGQLSVGPQHFFGMAVANVMTNSTKRPVDTVIEELRGARAFYESVRARSPNMDVRYIEQSSFPGAV